MLEINAKGRTIPPPEQVDEDGNPIEEEDVPEDVAPLRSLGEDGEGSWAVRITPNGSAHSSSSVVCVKSLHWPGAVAVAVGSKFVNVYVGDGVKFSSTPYSLPPPQSVLSEWCSNPDQEVEEGEDPVAPKLLFENGDVLTDPTPPEEEEEG